MVPKGSLLRALTDAATRGVDVRVLIPGVSDVPVMTWVRCCCLVCGMMLVVVARWRASLRAICKVAACFADRLLNAGARVFACVYSDFSAAFISYNFCCSYQGRVLHAKTMVVDDLALVGSHNLNYRHITLSPSCMPPCSRQPPLSFRSIVHDLESEVILGHAGSISVLTHAFAADMLNSAELQLPALAHLRWWQRAAARMALWFKRML